MALVLNLKCVDNLRGKSDRVARCTFRDNVIVSKVIRNAKNAAYFGDSFEWPVARSIEPNECIVLEFYNHNKYLSDKLIGSFTLCLQYIIEDGHLELCEPLTDHNNRTTQETATFEVKYYSPDGKVGDWNTDQFSYPLIEELKDGEEPSKVKGQGYRPEIMEETDSMRSFSINVQELIDNAAVESENDR